MDKTKRSNCKRKTEAVQKNVKKRRKLADCDLFVNDDKRKILNVLENQDLDFHITDELNNSPLHLIFQNKELQPNDVVEILDQLIDKTVSPKSRNKNGETALHLAAGHGIREAIDILIKHGAKVNVKDNVGNTPAHFFIVNERRNVFNSMWTDTKVIAIAKEKMALESVDFTEWLLSKKFDFNIQNDDKLSALDWAIGYRLKAILPLLFKYSTDVHVFKKCNDHELLLLYLESCRRYGYAKKTNIDTFVSLFKKGLTIKFPEIEEKTAIDLIIETIKEKDISELQIDKNELFHRVIDNDMWCRSDISEYTKILCFFIDKGCDINKENKFGLRPIQMAARDKNFYAVKFMINCSAESNVETYNGHNLLHLLAGKSKNGKADENSRKALYNLFLTTGYDVNCKDRLGRTPLHLAVEAKSHSEDIRLLLENGAYVNARNYSKETALALAIQHKLIDIIKELLSYGADLNDLSVKVELNELLHSWTDRDDNADNKLTDTLFTHILKLNYADIYCTEVLKDSTEGLKYFDSRLKTQENNILNEVIVLKTTYIDPRISLYDWLRKDSHHKRRQINNEALKNVVESPLLVEQFPNYSVLILASYRESMMRMSRIEQAKEVWWTMTEIYLPDICIELILSFLDNVELVRMIEE